MYLDRLKTRDRLLDYELPRWPHGADAHIVYPWENQSLGVFAKQLFTLAARSGYGGDMADFLNNFGKLLEQKSVIYANFVDFPAEGEDDKLYFALDEKILFYWAGGEYEPVKTTLIDNTILYSGDASEYYDA